jgi:putative FmdB family regulatory protein
LPTYGYRCPTCLTEFELWQSMRDDPGASCPTCGAAATRQFFPAGIVFKGSGFYKTDSRSAASSSITSDGGDSKSATNGTKPDGAKPGAAKADGPKADGAKSDAKTPASGASSSTSTPKPVSTDAAS